MVRNTVLAAAALLLLAFAGPESARADVNVDITIGGGHGRISCRQGARIVFRSGYHSVVALNCAGRFYKYRGWRGLRKFVITVRSSNGRIVDVDRVF